MLERHGDFEANRLSKSQLLALGPPSARDDIHLLSLIRSLADYLSELGLLAVPARTPSDRSLSTYQEHLLEVRGLASSTVRTHARLARDLLVYVAERLLRALPWETVGAFLASIDQTARTGRWDYAMFLMAATYGLRRSEIASLPLDDIRWREATVRIQRPKVRAPIQTAPAQGGPCRLTRLPAL